MTTRRTPPTRPGQRGRRGPGRATASGPRSTSRPSEPAAAAARVPSGATAMVATKARRPRLTGRMGILLLVLAVLTVSYASSLRAYFQQRSRIDASKSAISERQAEIESLTVEQRRLHDKSYLQQLVREELGYVRPGETLYVVSDDGLPLDAESTLTDPRDVGAKPVPAGWWTAVWDSVEDAGDPPKPEAPPASTISDPAGR